MAKSARASAVKANRANLRRRIYGPVEEERTKRLSAKLAQVASQPKPEQPDKMDVEQGMSSNAILFTIIRLEVSHLLTLEPQQTPQFPTIRARSRKQPALMVRCVPVIIFSKTSLTLVNLEMEIDHDSARQPTIRMKNSHKTPSRIQKPRRRKPQAQVVFPSLLKRKSSKHGKKGRK